MFLAAASATSSSSNNTPWWLLLVVAGIPAVAAVIAAIIAALSARSARRSDSQAARARELEDRISERKYNVYKPMIDMLRDLLDPKKSKDMAKDTSLASSQIADFAIWVRIYGSDGAVAAFHNFMQAAFHDPPSFVLLRLFADFVLAARRDMGYPDTQATRAQVLGMRVNDLYSQQQFIDIITKPFDEICREANWTPPWSVLEERR